MCFTTKLFCSATYAAQNNARGAITHIETLFELQAVKLLTTVYYSLVNNSSSYFNYGIYEMFQFYQIVYPT